MYWLHVIYIHPVGTEYHPSWARASPTGAGAGLEGTVRGKLCWAGQSQPEFTQRNDETICGATRGIVKQVLVNQMF